VDSDVESDAGSGQEEVGEGLAFRLRERSAARVGFRAWSIATLWKIKILKIK